MLIHTTDWQRSSQTVPQPVFAIGDVHGHLGLLEMLYAKLAERLDAHGSGQVVHVGDYIDRGPDSFATLDRVFEWSHPLATATHILPGNHEQMMLSFLHRPRKATGSLWLGNGGSAAIKPLEVPLQEYGRTDLPALAVAVEARLRPVMRRLMGLPTAVRIGDYFFVHAGVPGGRRRWSLERVLNYSWIEGPDENDPLWVRYLFLNDPDPHEDGVRVVHGHTPTKGEPEVLDNRINIDTGSYLTHRLTMIEIVDDAFRFHIASTDSVEHERR